VAGLSENDASSPLPFTDGVLAALDGSAEAPRPPLLDALRGGQDWRSRQSAALELARAGGERALSAREERALGDALTGDPDWRVREAALQALEPCASPAATRVLAAAAEDPHVTLRLAAVRILSQRLGALTTSNALLRRLDRDPDWRIRDVALQGLLRSKEGARAASMAFVDRHRKLCEQARAALASLR